MIVMLVAIGAALGAPARLLVNHWMRARWATTPVAGTLTVNVIGSFVLGCLTAAAVGGSWTALVGVGFCGSFTTFSTLALELQEAFTDGRQRHAVVNVALHLGLGVGAAWLGWLAAH